MTDFAAMQRSLDGLSVGDALGQRFFFQELREIRGRQLPAGPWPYTDDTEMALSLVEMLRNHGAIDQDRLATAFACRYNPQRGYGGGAHQLLEAIGRSETGSWRMLTPAMFGGRGSFGNGAAMRVAPLGAYFCQDYGRAAEQARLSSLVTHSHKEGVAGGIAVAVAAAWLSREQTWDRDAFFETVLEHTPSGEVRDGLKNAHQLPVTFSGNQAAGFLGSGQRVTAQDTVPFTLWSVAVDPSDYVETFWRTVEGLGDQDTTCAIACGVVACRTPPPADWVATRESLPI